MTDVIALSATEVPSPEALAALSDDEVAEQVTTWAGRVAAGEARLLAYVGELDRREAWAGVGVLSCAHWLSWRLGMGLKAAHERVRVARALRSLPATGAAFQAGRVSWTQVRAITRVATADDEQTYVALARHASGAQIERLVRGVRRAHKLAEDSADPQAAAHRMRTTVRYDDDGTLVVRARLPAEQGALVLAALEAARVDLDADRRHASSAEDAPDAAPAPTLADALVDLARDRLDRRERERPAAARRSRAALTVQVDPLSGWGRLHDGELLPPSSMQQVGLTLPGRMRRRRLPRPRGDTLTGHGRGRTRREPDLGLRELLGAVDGERCRFPGCSRKRKLHAHHVQWWSDGGRTELENLVLLCSRHHTLVHRDGFVLVLRPDRRLDVATAYGEPVPHHPGLPWRPAPDLDPDERVGPDTLPPAVHDRLHLTYAVSVVLQQAA